MAAARTASLSTAAPTVRLSGCASRANCNLPAGTPAILNSMTASARVERVLVDELSLGPSTIRNLEVPALRKAIWAAREWSASTRSSSSA